MLFADDAKFSIEYFLLYSPNTCNESPTPITLKANNTGTIKAFIRLLFILSLVFITTHTTKAGTRAIITYALMVKTIKLLKMVTPSHNHLRVPPIRNLSILYTIIPRNPRTMLSFIIPEPQKNTEGTNRTAIAN